jgi:glycosyltransferase involved in cell wall biosynthesis
MPDWLKNMAKKRTDIEITENIPDARDAYRTASVMVAPIKGAGGTRLKILEAMASGLPVVSTTIGVAGLKVEDGKNVLIADTPTKLAEKAIMLLKNPKMAEEIGEKGRQHVTKYFDWMSIVKLHDPIYTELMEEKND